MLWDAASSNPDRRICRNPPTAIGLVQWELSGLGAQHPIYCTSASQCNSSLCGAIRIGSKPMEKVVSPYSDKSRGYQGQWREMHRAASALSIFSECEQIYPDRTVECPYLLHDLRLQHPFPHLSLG